MNRTKAQRLAQRDSDIIHDLQFIADELAPVKRAAVHLVNHAVFIRPRTSWWHYLLPDFMRLRVGVEVDDEPERQGEQAAPSTSEPA